MSRVLRFLILKLERVHINDRYKKKIMNTRGKSLQF